MKAKAIGTAIAATLLASFAISGAGAAEALPGGCTPENPYPSGVYNVCTTVGPGGIGSECAAWRCAYPPGTPGKWDVNGNYKPKTG